MRDPALLIIRLARTDGTDWVVKYNEVLGWRVPGVLIITYRKLHLSLIVPLRPVMVASAYTDCTATHSNVSTFHL